ncbi:MAG: B-box zinc finger protein [Dehalococcoidia bacterium]|nr:B-box zinc finger protein [Dehalococcoidia bacterium]
MTSLPTPAPEEVTYCQRHPTVESELRCGRCETLICPRCLVYTPAGTRCPDCAKLRRPPMYEFAARDYLVLAATSIGVAVALGVIGALVLPVGIRGFLFLTLAIFGGTALGGGIAELLQRATRYKRGPAIQVAAVATLVGAAVIRLTLAGGLQLVAADLAVTLLLVIAAAVAWGRLR